MAQRPTRWAIVYSDETTFTDADGPWESAPGRDIQVVLYNDRRLGWTMRHGARGGSRCDFFRLDKDGTCVGMDQAGMIDHCIYELGLGSWDSDLMTLIRLSVHEAGLLKQGRMLSGDHWQSIHRFAMELRNELRRGDGSS